MTRAGQHFFVHADHQGSVVRVTDAAGTVVNSYAYEAYGQRLAATEGVALPYGYTGREYDPESGLDGVRIHDLRHTYASNAVSRGMPIQMVASCSATARSRRRCVTRTSRTTR